MLAHYDVDGDDFFSSSSSSSSSSSFASKWCKCIPIFKELAQDRKKFAAVLFSAFVSLSLLVMFFIFIFSDVEEPCEFPSSGYTLASTQCCQQLCTLENDKISAEGVSCSALTQLVDNNNQINENDGQEEREIIECYLLSTKECSCFSVPPYDEAGAVVMFITFITFLSASAIGLLTVFICKRRENCKEAFGECCENRKCGECEETSCDSCKSRFNCCSCCCKREVEPEENVFYTTTSSLSGLAMGLVEGVVVDS